MTNELPVLPGILLTAVAVASHAGIGSRVRLQETVQHRSPLPSRGALSRRRESGGLFAPAADWASSHRHMSAEGRKHRRIVRRAGTPRTEHRTEAKVRVACQERAGGRGDTKGDDDAMLFARKNHERRGSLWVVETWCGMQGSSGASRAQSASLREGSESMEKSPPADQARLLGRARL